MIRRLRYNSDGFTLIELILVISILGIVVSMASGSIVQIFKTVPPSSERMNDKQMVEIRLIEISNFIRNDNGTVEFIEDDNEVIMKDHSGNKLRSFSNISDMKINENSNIYEIVIEKCVDENCADPIKISSKVTKRK